MLTKIKKNIIKNYFKNNILLLIKILKIISAVKSRLIASKISFCVHNICMCTVYFIVVMYYVYINTHTCMYIFKKNMVCLYIKYIYI